MLPTSHTNDIDTGYQKLKKKELLRKCEELAVTVLFLSEALEVFTFFCLL